MGERTRNIIIPYNSYKTGRVKKSKTQKQQQTITNNNKQKQKQARFPQNPTNWPVAWHYASHYFNIFL